jgi:hypothetical protein
MVMRALTFARAMSMLVPGIDALSVRARSTDRRKKWGFAAIGAGEAADQYMR